MKESEGDLMQNARMIRQYADEVWPLYSRLISLAYGVHLVCSVFLEDEIACSIVDNAKWAAIEYAIAAEEWNIFVEPDYTLPWPFPQVTATEKDVLRAARMLHQAEQNGSAGDISEKVHEFTTACLKLPKNRDLVLYEVAGESLPAPMIIEHDFIAYELASKCKPVGTVKVIRFQ